MIVHPLPTTSTAKQLYATAATCGYEGCKEPLYAEDADAGIWVLNSEISHICARREGGPRWNQKQTAEENRSPENLILMCHKHAAEIDDKSGRERFTVELLQGWKKAQLQARRIAPTGWPLTEKMAKEVIEASAHVGIAINGSTVHLGGEGGKAPGAGGGGGGAIGKRARGGPGGPGGRITSRLESEELLQLSSDDNDPPGSGGGGAPTFGPDAVGGPGGGGGDTVLGELALEPGDVVEVTVGEGGMPARLPGQHGKRGGDSSIVVRSADGRVKRVVSATGGQGAESGQFPIDWATISDADLAGGFAVTTLMVANEVQIERGLVSVSGGGWAAYTVKKLPHDAVWMVLCGATWDRIEVGPTRGLKLCLDDPAGVEVSRVALAIAPEYQSGTNILCSTPLGASLDSAGRWRLSLRSGHLLLAQIVVEVREG